MATKEEIKAKAKRDREMRVYVDTYVNRRGFKDRGDPSDYDFKLSTPDFTTNGAWHDLDLSSIVPAGAIAVLLLIAVKDGVVNQVFQVRENGNSNAYNTDWIGTQVAGVYSRGSLKVACDANRVIEYWATSTTWTDIVMTVRGWWI